MPFLVTRMVDYPSWILFRYSRIYSKGRSLSAFGSSNNAPNSSNNLKTYLNGFSYYLKVVCSFSCCTLTQKVSGIMKKGFSCLSSEYAFTFLNNSCLLEISPWYSTWFTIYMKLCESLSKLIGREVGLHLKWKCDYVWLASSTQEWHLVSLNTLLTKLLLFPYII